MPFHFQARTQTAEAQLVKVAQELKQTKQQKDELAQKLQQVQISHRHLMIEKASLVRRLSSCPCTA